MSKSVNQMTAQREIRVYRNRRLYDTADHRYITYRELYALLEDGRTFTIHEHSTGVDYTDSVILDLALQREAESKAALDGPLLTSAFLLELIRLKAVYPDGLLRAFLDQCMETLASGWRRPRAR
jgi:polyhydroxyalkanoate synthesis repressor PhaR